jgi:hypothetical protein
VSITHNSEYIYSTLHIIYIQPDLYKVCVFDLIVCVCLCVFLYLCSLFFFVLIDKHENQNHLSK